MIEGRLTDKKSSSEMSYVGEWKDDKQNGSGTIKIRGIVAVVFATFLFNGEEKLKDLNDELEPEVIELLKTAECRIVGQFQNGEPHGEIVMKVEVTKDEEKRTFCEYSGIMREGRAEGTGTFSNQS